MDDESHNWGFWYVQMLRTVQLQITFILFMNSKNISISLSYFCLANFKNFIRALKSLYVAQKETNKVLAIQINQYMKFLINNRIFRCLS